MLETISDVNTPALRLYEKLGFTEFKRKKVRHTRLTGIGHYVSMRLVQPARTPTEWFGLRTGLYGSALSRHRW